MNEYLTAEEVDPGIDKILWSAKIIAYHLDCGPAQVLDRYAPRPDFPKPIRLPTVDGRKGRPRWKAKEIIEWIEAWQEK